MGKEQSALSRCCSQRSKQQAVLLLLLLLPVLLLLLSFMLLEAGVDGLAGQKNRTDRDLTPSQCSDHTLNGAIKAEGYQLSGLCLVMSTACRSVIVSNAVTAANPESAPAAASAAPAGMGGSGPASAAAAAAWCCCEPQGSSWQAAVDLTAACSESLAGPHTCNWKYKPVTPAIPVLLVIRAGSAPVVFVDSTFTLGLVLMQQPV